MNNENAKSGKVQEQRVRNRRVKESGPPSGQKERRISVEKRKPEVAEGSLEEWEALMGISHTQATSKTQDEPALTDWEGLRRL